MRSETGLMDNQYLLEKFQERRTVVAEVFQHIRHELMESTLFLSAVQRSLRLEAVKKDLSDARGLDDKVYVRVLWGKYYRLFMPDLEDMVQYLHDNPESTIGGHIVRARLEIGV